MKGVFFAILFFFSLVVLFPEAGLAQTPEGLVSCGNPGQPDCDLCGLVETTDNLIDFLFKMLVLCAVLVLMYAGFKMVVSQGDVGAWTKAKEMLSNVVIGIVIVASAWLVVDTLLKALLSDEFKAGGEFGPWNDLGDCSFSSGGSDDGDDVASEDDLSLYCYSTVGGGITNIYGRESCQSYNSQARANGQTVSACYVCGPPR